MLTSLTHSTLQSSSLVKCHLNALFFLTLRFSKFLVFQLIKSLTYKHNLKPTETFQYTHFSSCHPFNCKKGFIKGEALRFLRTNSVRENIVKKKRDFEHRLCKRDFRLFKKHWQTLSSPTERKSSTTKQHKQNRLYRLLLPTIRPHRIAEKILMKHWNIVQQQPKLQKIFNQSPIVSYRKKKIPQRHPCPRENFFNLANNQKTNKAVKSKLEDNLHTITVFYYFFSPKSGNYVFMHQYQDFCYHLVL